MAAGLAQQLLELVNTERASMGVPQLAVNASLLAAAEDYAAFHFLNADPLQLSHDLDGAMMDRLRQHGYIGVGAEVLVAGSPDAQVLMDVWLDSPQHGDILLGAQYVHIGVGCYQGPYVDPNGTRFDLALCVADLGYV